MPITADDNDPAAAAARLEAALDRIAGLAQRPPRPPEPVLALASHQPVASDVAARLDALIERVRSALGAG